MFVNVRDLTRFRSDEKKSTTLDRHKQKFMGCNVKMLKKGKRYRSDIQTQKVKNKLTLPNAKKKMKRQKTVHINTRWQVVRWQSSI